MPETPSPIARVVAAFVEQVSAVTQLGMGVKTPFLQVMIFSPFDLFPMGQCRIQVFGSIMLTLRVPSYVDSSGKGGHAVDGPGTGVGEAVVVVVMVVAIVSHVAIVAEPKAASSTASFSNSAR